MRFGRRGILDEGDRPVARTINLVAAWIGKKGELRLWLCRPTGIKFQVSNKFKIRSPKGKPVSLTKSAGNDPVAASCLAL